MTQSFPSIIWWSQRDIKISGSTGDFHSEWDPKTTLLIEPFNICTIRITSTSWAWWHTPIIAALRRLRLKDFELQASLSYTVDKKKRKQRRKVEKKADGQAGFIVLVDFRSLTIFFIFHDLWNSSNDLQHILPFVQHANLPPPVDSTKMIILTSSRNIRIIKNHPQLCSLNSFSKHW